MSVSEPHRRGSKPGGMDALEEAVWFRKKLKGLKESAATKEKALRDGLSAEAKAVLAGAK